MNRNMILIMLVAAGCSTTQAVSGFRPYTVADMSASKWDRHEDVKLAPRLGAVGFLGAENDVPSRPSVGLFGRLMETDQRRVEIAIDLVPSTGDDRLNLYTTLTGDYVYFVSEGSFFWKAGGGVAVETRDETNYFVGLLQAGVGLWLPVGEDQAFVIAGSLQIPVGEANPAAMTMITAGYEF